ncbi:MAG: alkaline phosphatase D family protein [Flavobacteriaceae bacterium]|nr:alkaline phosphatase D family protein [Flavobacteriaceae bacterium]
MKRRDYIKTISLGSLLPLISGFGTSKLYHNYFEGPQKVVFKSKWHLWGDMKWAGPEYWGNTLQDWILQNGKMVCDITAKDRNLHLLTLQNPDGNAQLTMEVVVHVKNEKIPVTTSGCVGFRIGAKGPFDDYRSAAVFGKGFDVGISPNGQLKIGAQTFNTNMQSLPVAYKLVFSTKKKDTSNQLVTVEIKEVDSDKDIFIKEDIIVSTEDLKGNLALLSDIDVKDKQQQNTPSVSFENWTINSDELYQNESNLFGPICFAQYTLHKKKLKLTGQFSPFETIKDHKIEIAFKHAGIWQTASKTTLEHVGRSVNFQFSDWNYHTDVPYKLTVFIPLKDAIYKYEYEGTISKEPIEKSEIKAAVFSCNFHYGFPDSDVHEGVSKLNPDVIMFLGDQFYEGSGGFGSLYTGDYDKKCLDYLRKWMMFGWSYREIFRHKPCAIIPDDHDVYHGNLWGEEGKEADVSKGFGAFAQDSGGYKMQAEWVNMVQFTQTSHLPDPYDPAPVKQNIGVYYTQWNYAGISFAILEDRKFKSSPKSVLPESAQVNNGWIMSDDFDIKEYKHLDAELLGKRQTKFLNQWVHDWSEGAQMKAVLSQTNFATVATLPEGTKTGEVIPSLYIPEVGEYIKGDKPTVDMDSNGWPSAKRDEALSIIRKAFAFHIAGDQHLGSFIQYGLDEHQDSGFAFAVPALNNIWPRRFWPPVNSANHTIDKPAYVGNHIDGFGNKMNVLAVANPHNMHKKPEILHNRAVGYGIVTFNKQNRTIKTECFKRFCDPTKEDSQYPGWPIIVKQEDNYGRLANAYLPEIKFAGITNPVVKIINEQSNEIIYVLRINQGTFKAKVFDGIATYTIKVGDPDKNIWQEKKTVSVGEKKIVFKF